MFEMFTETATNNTHEDKTKSWINESLEHLLDL